MSKEDAMQALLHGQKLTHDYFTPNEWVIARGNIYVFEDGVEQWKNDFWQMRGSIGWQSGWRLYNPKTD